MNSIETLFSLQNHLKSCSEEKQRIVGFFLDNSLLRKLPEFIFITNTHLRFTVNRKMSEKKMKH